MGSEIKKTSNHACSPGSFSVSKATEAMTREETKQKSLQRLEILSGLRKARGMHCKGLNLAFMEHIAKTPTYQVKDNLSSFPVPYTGVCRPGTQNHGKHIIEDLELLDGHVFPV